MMILIDIVNMQGLHHVSTDAKAEKVILSVTRALIILFMFTAKCASYVVPIRRRENFCLLLRRMVISEPCRLLERTTLIRIVFLFLEEAFLVVEKYGCWGLRTRKSLRLTERVVLF